MRQAEHETAGAALKGEREQARGIGLEGRAQDGFDAGGQPAVGIGHSDADGLGAEVEADQRAAAGPLRGGFDQGQNGGRHRFA